jgi:penicillin-binding protein 1A
MSTTSPGRWRPRPVTGAGRGRRRRRHSARFLRRLVGAALVLVVLAALSLVTLVLASPSVGNAPGLVSTILASHRSPGDGGRIPARLGQALLATEDSRFYHDPALDPFGVARALLGLVSGDGNDGGATIEQQLAKMLYAPGTTLSSELEQVGVAFRLDSMYSKARILAMYLDAAYFGDGAYGCTAAAEHYFGVPPDRLSWAQASLLAGLVQAPSEYDPHGHLALARSRQRHVLARLVAIGDLTSAQAARIYSEPLDPKVRFYG